MEAYAEAFAQSRDTIWLHNDDDALIFGLRLFYVCCFMYLIILHHIISHACMTPLNRSPGYSFNVRFISLVR